MIHNFLKSKVSEMVHELVEAISQGNHALAQELVESILRQKISDKINVVKEEITPKFDAVKLMESLKSRLLVRKGKVKRRWSYVGGDSFHIRGKEYAAKVAQVNPYTGRRKESRRSAAQVRDKIITMKRLWKSSLRSQLPRMLRKRSLSNKIAKHLEVY